MTLEINKNQHTVMMPINFFLDWLIFLRVTAPDLLENLCLQLFLNYYIAARISTPFFRSIAHKHKDLRAQTSHQPQTSHHWRGISFH